MTLVLRPDDSDDRRLLGGKAAALAMASAAGLPVPAWVVVPPAAFEASLSPEHLRALDAACRAGNAAAAASVLEGLRPPPELATELICALATRAPGGEPLAVRSSAVDEDGAQRSFAGQLESLLFVPPDRVLDAVADVWRSGYSARILAYRREHGLDSVPPPPAVLVQRMVDAEVAGVAFSADPVSGRRAVAVVSAVYGLGSALVSGEADADTYHVDRSGAIHDRALADKRQAHRRALAGEPGESGEQGVRTVSVPDELTRRPALSDEQVRAVAALARRCQYAFGVPQDIEWAIQDGALYLLQSRPITSLAGVADPDGAYALWDNSNIAESYAGVTTPLTFSFARHAYEEVYRQLCRVLGVSEVVIARHDDTFRHMIGLVRGRVYYSLLSWYRLLALAPGFASNRRFMEQMMGVKEGLPQELVDELAQATWSARLLDRWRLVRTVADLLRGYRRLPRDIQRFYARVEAALAPGAVALEDMRPDELVAYYRDLERQLLRRWDAPLVNDLFAMMFYGTLRRLVTSWCRDASGSLQNDLLTGGGGIVSAEPALLVRKLAALAGEDPGFVDALSAAPLSGIQSAVLAHPAFAAVYTAYLDKFADRCLEELKLESPTLRDDPLPLLRSIGHLARRMQARPATASDTGEADRQVRVRAEQRAARALRLHPLRRRAFAFVLRNARERVRDRENMRFERTRVFGRVRRIFVELGRRFAALGVLDDPRDIFYLEVEEVLGSVTGTATTTDLRGLVALRQAEFARYRDSEPPAERFATRGVVYVGNSFTDDRPAVEAPAGGERDDDARTGIGCCPGVVTCRVHVVTDPKSAELRGGEILVAERTDPGWIMLFPAAAGVLVERGSLLSHSAIVAREMGIPTVVAIPGLVRWLRDGDEVRMDGGTGAVVRLAAVPTAVAAPPVEEAAHG
jgi:pyruvate,water dikinase